MKHLSRTPSHHTVLTGSGRTMGLVGAMVLALFMLKPWAVDAQNWKKHPVQGVVEGYGGGAHDDFTSAAGGVNLWVRFPSNSTWNQFVTPYIGAVYFKSLPEQHKREWEELALKLGVEVGRLIHHVWTLSVDLEADIPLHEEHNFPAANTDERRVIPSGGVAISYELLRSLEVFMRVGITWGDFNPRVDPNSDKHNKGGTLRLGAKHFFGWHKKPVVR